MAQSLHRALDGPVSGFYREDERVRVVRRWHGAVPATL